MGKPRIPLEDLRARIAEALAAAVKSYNLPACATRLGLSEGTSEEAHRSKRLYVLNRLQGWSEADLLKVASQVVDEYDSPELADALSALITHADQRVSELTRREILKVTDSLDPLFGDHTSSIFENLDVMRPRWDIAPNADNFWRSLKDEVQQHYLRNPDWQNSELLEKCGALKCSQARFFGVLEALLHPLVRRGEPQQELMNRFAEVLRADGFRIIIAGYESRHPVYAIRRLTSGVTGAPKNLIFASAGEKPEIVLRDAINNDVVITKHADKCLIYDRPLPPSGLKWVEMARWWQETQQIDDLKEARRALGKRLSESVRLTHSPPEYWLFKTYYEVFGPTLGDDLPALIPQVYLHYDPQTLAQRRGRVVLPRQRMDFLMLLDHSARIVLEVDGKHHYADGDQASPSRYAEMVREDRAVRLRGYEVYRFGGAEFPDAGEADGGQGMAPESRARIVEFFAELFRRHGIRIPPES